jgi:hypothetical protein
MVRLLQLGQLRETSNAQLILQRAHDSAQAFLDAFRTVRDTRGAGQGTTTDEEQDLLRAVLVVAAAGLDSMLKTLIHDGLPSLVKINASVQRGLETFVERQLRGDPAGAVGFTGHKFLAKIMASDSIRDRLIDEYIQDLTGGSLQSPEELMRTANALGISPDQAGIDATRLHPIFKARNEIVHELDINFNAPRRRRNSRSRDGMVKFATKLLEIGENILAHVEKVLATPAS